MKPHFWRRRLLEPILRQLTQGVTPGKIAMTLAVGSGIAVFPVLGSTTALCFLAGICFGLNQPIIQTVNGLCTFVYFPLLVLFIRLGDALSGTASSIVNIPLMITMATHHPEEFFRRFGIVGLHAILGWVVVMPAWVGLIYLATLFPLRAAARKFQSG